jgi:hypothetical protein
MPRIAAVIGSKRRMRSPNWIICKVRNFSGWPASEGMSAVSDITVRAPSLQAIPFGVVCASAMIRWLRLPPWSAMA